MMAHTSPLHIVEQSIWWYVLVQVGNFGDSQCETEIEQQMLLCAEGTERKREQQVYTGIADLY
jgi:hypothetical protein